MIKDVFVKDLKLKIVHRWNLKLFWEWLMIGLKSSRYNSKNNNLPTVFFNNSKAFSFIMMYWETLKKIFLLWVKIYTGSFRNSFLCYNRVVITRQSTRDNFAQNLFICPQTVQSALLPEDLLLEILYVLCWG